MYLEHSEIIFNAFHGYGSYSPYYYALTMNSQFNIVSLYFHLMAGLARPFDYIVASSLLFYFREQLHGLGCYFLCSHSDI